VKDTLQYVEHVLDTEINAATDNPTVCPDEDLAISAGNFHGEPMAQPFDFLGIGIAEIANVSERRLERLINPQLNDLPAFLTPQGGLNSGYMITQYACAALVSENKILAHPASVDSIPSSANQEDLVSMGTIAARTARDILVNSVRVLATELMAACQAIDFRKDLNLKLGRGTQKAYDAIRAVTDFEYELQLSLTNKVIAPDIDTVFLTTNLKYLYLSSSMVKEIALYNGDISEFVDDVTAIEVFNKLKQKKKNA